MPRRWRDRMGAKGALILAACAFFVGFGGGSNAQPPPETKIIKVPTVETRIETKEVPAPLPEACKQAIDAMEALSKNDATITKNAGKVQLASQNLTTASAMRDIPAMNEQVEIIRAANSALSEAILTRNQLFLDAQRYTETCQTETKK
ncbi:MAG TPA: hypothetical protein VIY48_18900 [Candidatus Paceibacterota bacterium]